LYLACFSNQFHQPHLKVVRQTGTLDLSTTQQESTIITNLVFIRGLEFKFYTEAQLTKPSVGKCDFLLSTPPRALGVRLLNKRKCAPAQRRHRCCGRQQIKITNSITSGAKYLIARSVVKLSVINIDFLHMCSLRDLVSRPTRRLPSQTLSGAQSQSRSA